MDRRTKVELFEQIRREYEHGGGTIRGIAKKLGIHRRMVREAVLSAIPIERKTPVRERPKLEPAMAFIDALLEADRKAPRKQRHTAHRIWCRIRAEMPGVEVAESTIRRHVRERKIKLGLTRRETFIPQSYSWGAEAQVDWYEAYAEICGERQKAYLFCMRSMASGGAFHHAFPHASQQAFLEAHELAFAYFGGVFTKLRYDNLKSAVKKILRGYQREETTRFMAFRSHWGLRRSFVRQEKVTRRVAWRAKVVIFVATILVPMPQVASWEELNVLLREASKKDEQRMIGERTQTVGAGMHTEREHLRTLAEEGFDLAAVHFSPCERQRLHPSADQLLLGSTPGRRRSAGQSLFHVRRDMASGAVCSPARTLLRSTAEDSGSGALSGSTDEEARSTCRFDTARTVASAGTLAGKLRSLLGDVEATARPAGLEHAR